MTRAGTMTSTGSARTTASAWAGTTRTWYPRTRTCAPTGSPATASRGTPATSANEVRVVSFVFLYLKASSDVQLSALLSTQNVKKSTRRVDKAETENSEMPPETCLWCMCLDQVKQQIVPVSGNCAELVIVNVITLFSRGKFKTTDLLPRPDSAQNMEYRGQSAWMRYIHRELDKSASVQSLTQFVIILQQPHTSSHKGCAHNLKD